MRLWPTAMALALAGCGDAAEPWALRAIERDHVFPTRDDNGRVVPEGMTVTAAELERGRLDYLHFCASCHGLDGDGRGRSADAGWLRDPLDPPARDFRSAQFKFAAVRSGELPNDHDLTRIIAGGLGGTAMPAWGLPDDRVWQMAQFLKTFPGPENRWLHTYPRGPRAGLPRPTGEPIVIGADPWAGREAEAIARGERLYHQEAQCNNCHPSYRAELPASARQNPRQPIVLAAKDNPYRVDVRAPDFQTDELRSVRPEQELGDLYRVVSAGVGGIMPAWVDALGEPDRWALAHYLRSVKP